MFRRLHDPAETLIIVVNGRQISAGARDTVAAVLLLDGQQVFRRTVRTGAARAPYCGMGTCFECQVTIDGQPGVQACLVEVRAGMVIETDPDAVLASP